MPSLIGNKPNQVPTNGDLGTLAFQDSNAVTLGGGNISGNFSSSGINIDSNTFVIDTANNRVGIGTSSPSSLLHLNNSSGNAELKLNSSDSGTVAITFGAQTDGATGSIGFYHSDNSLRFSGYNNSERMRIDSSGNVGIGTSSPSSRLTVGGNPPSSGVIAGVASAGGRSLALSDNVNSSLYVTHPSGSPVTFATDSGGAIAFATNGTTERMRIDSIGNVGIGVSPATRFHTQGGRVRIDANSENFALQLNNSTTGNGCFLGSAGADTFVISASSGAERMRIDSSGNVGIGTSAPEEVLELDRSGNAFVRFDKTGTFQGLVGITQNAGQGSSGSAAGDMIVRSQARVLLDTGGTTRATIDSSGRMLIGTSTALSTSPRLQVQRTDATVGATNYQLAWFQNATGFGNGIGLYAQDNVAGISADFAGASGGAAALAFYTNSTTTPLNPTERMRIDSSGNVGIGTSSPSNKLEVNGGITTSDNASATNTLGRYSAGYPWSLIRPSSTSNGFEFRDNPGNQLYSITQTTGSQNHIWYTAASERMRIDSSGNVGIGTTSPAYKLQVNGISASRDAADPAFITNVNGTQALYLHSTSGGSEVTELRNLPLFFATNATERMRITSDGEVYIAGTTDQGAYNLQVNGTGVWGAGAYVNGSDERIKDNIAPLDSGLDVVAKLNPVTYKYKEDWSKDQSTQTGFIAQELLTALDGKNYVDGVVQQGGKYMSVAYQNIIPILTKAIQEQQAMIEELKQEVALLKSK